MNRAITTVFLRCYPAAWRKRYGEEFAALLAEEPTTAWVILDIFWSAMREQIVLQVERGSTMMKTTSMRQKMLFVIPVLLLLANAQFAYVSYRHAHAARSQAEAAARTGDANGVRFWKAMEEEEGGEYTDSIHFGLGFIVGISVVGTLVAWNQKRRRRLA